MNRSIMRNSFILLPLLIGCSGVDAGLKLPREPYYDPDAATEGGTLPDEPGDDDDSNSGTDAGPQTAPDIDAIAWRTGVDIGTGVAMKDAANPAGSSLFVAYGGFNVSLEATEAWASALYKSTLQAKGVRYIWAVQGPAQSNYAGLEIGNSKIATAMTTLVTPTTKYILVAAHSSGSFVAHELLNQLANGRDPGNVTQGKVIYFNLDGGSQGGAATTGLSSTVVGRLKKAYFVSPMANGTDGFNTATMQSLGATYAGSGGYFTVDSSASGCGAGNHDCVHISLITTKPHNPAGPADPTADYADYAGRSVTTAYLDMKAAEAGIAP